MTADICCWRFSGTRKMSSRIEPPTHISWFMESCWGEEAKARQFSLWPVGGGVGTVKSLESPKQGFGIVNVLAATEHFFQGRSW